MVVEEKGGKMKKEDGWEEDDVDVDLYVNVYG